MASKPRISIVGIGYVGLPLAVALAKHYEVTALDADPERIAQLQAGVDRTREIDPATLRKCTATFTADPGDIARADIFIITVPTPVDGDSRPDLSALSAACGTVGGVMGKGAIVVIESTVYPGVTEEICGPDLEAASGLECGRDFFLGYSPERINPGDPEHSVERITKVVAGQTPEVAARLGDIYGAITSGGVFTAKDIRTAEAAKVIENAQRDLNIAFINEVTMIFNRLGLSIHDVLEAANTKWNFLDFKPGAVGGHCIGIDPFYLAHVARTHGHNPEIILAGRRINDDMGAYIAARIADEIAAGGSSRGAGKVLVLGLAFKEDVPDLRNSKVIDIVRGLRSRGHGVEVHDPLADPAEAMALYKIALRPTLDGAEGYGCVVGAVSHSSYRAFTAETLSSLIEPNGLVADIKGMWRHLALPPNLRRWQL